MNDLFLLAADATDLFGKPFWEQPDRFASPGMIAIGVALFSLWKLWQGTASFASKVGQTLSLLQTQLPAIIAALQRGQQVTPPPVPSPAPAPAAPPTLPPPPVP